MGCTTSEDIIVKSPTEVLLIGMDFTERLLDSDTIVERSVSFDPTGITVADISVSGNSVNFTISGGEHGLNYKCAVTIETTLGETLVGYGILKVREG